VLAVTAVVALATTARRGTVEPFVWNADIADFGGFSGIELTDGGRRLIAVSDAGYLVEGSVERRPDGAIARIGDIVVRTFLQNHGQAVNEFQGDAEALRLDPQGHPVVAFESYVRVARFPTGDMTPEPLNAWNRFRDLWGNQAIEALAIGSDGGMIAVLEMPGGTPPTYATLLYRGGQTWVAGPGLATDGRFQATDADFGPDGALYVLERRLSIVAGYTMRISAYRTTGDGYGAPQVAAESEAGEFGNFEGMDVRADADGRLIATLITDDNFLPDSATVIAEFPLGR
jgi:hypothetical protein